MACAPVIPIAVITLQQALWARVYRDTRLPDPGRIDGRWGPKTRTAFMSASNEVMPTCVAANAGVLGTPSGASIVQVPLDTVSHWGSLARLWAREYSTRARDSGLYPYAQLEAPRTGATVPAPAPSTPVSPPPAALPFVPTTIPPGVDPIDPIEVHLPRVSQSSASNIPLFIAGVAAVGLAGIGWLAWSQLPKRRRT